MTTQDILQILQQDIHSTVDDAGLPQTCVIDLMLADGDGLYFLTTKGKSFYDRLMARPFVALSGMKRTDIHDHPDDFATQPSGSSGIKIACGIFDGLRELFDDPLFENLEPIIK